MTVLVYPSGAPVDWGRVAKDPRRVSLPAMLDHRATDGLTIHGSMFVMCWLEWASAKAAKRYGQPIQVIQPCFNDKVAASAGTHDFDYCIDCRIPGVSYSEVQRFLRFECGAFFWWRTPAQGFSDHCHGFPLPPGGHVFPTRVGEYVDGGLSSAGRVYTSSQIDDGWRNSYGLKGMHGSGEDRSPWPTTSQKMAGIFDLDAYIKTQEDEMAAGYADWSDEDKKEFWDDFSKFVDGPRMQVNIRGGDGKVKPVPFLNAVARSANNKD